MSDRTLTLAKSMRRTPTRAEAVLWRHLRAGRMGGLRFRRQQPIGPYIVDFVCFERKLIVEADGGQHGEAVDYDSARTGFLNASGFRVLRFWNNQVLNEHEAVLEAIHRALER